MFCESFNTSHVIILRSGTAHSNPNVTIFKILFNTRGFLKSNFQGIFKLNDYTGAFTAVVFLLV